jgi:hypothetical protein
VDIFSRSHSLCGGGPEDVVKDYYKAFEKKDAGKLNDLTCESSDESKALIEEMFDEIDSVEVKDLKIDTMAF